MSARANAIAAHVEVFVRDIVVPYDATHGAARMVLPPGWSMNCARRPVLQAC
jgi:hypothetical protein